MPHFYRCGQCRTRRVLKRSPPEYIRIPPCRVCGARDYRHDSYRLKEWRTKTGSYAVCYCDGMHHPHRVGSTVWCRQHPTGPSESDMGCQRRRVEDEWQCPCGLCWAVDDPEPPQCQGPKRSDAARDRAMSEIRELLNQD